MLIILILDVNVVKCQIIKSFASPIDSGK
jgi:hypothetical protein